METAVTNCLVTAWSPAWDSMNSQWLQGTKLTPMCWPFEVLALKRCTKSEVSHRITKSPHAFLFKGEPKKKQPDPRWWEKQAAFCYLPAAAEVWETSLHCRRFFSGGNVSMQNTAGKVRMQAVFSDWALLVLIHLYLLPSRTQKWLKMIETDKAGKQRDRITSYSSRWIKEEVRRTPPWRFLMFIS